jgi:Ca2+-binding RTX toxin-like protein
MTTEELQDIFKKEIQEDLFEYTYDAPGDEADSYTGHDKTSGPKRFSDFISGSDGDDTYDGRGGMDLLMGWGGDDRLLGGDDNDTLVGGTGADYIDGGAGSMRPGSYPTQRFSSTSSILN